MKLTLQFADKAGIAWAQEQVTRFHYLKKPVDVRCSIQGYIIFLDLCRVGCLLFGRPESVRCTGWYGGVEDVLSGTCRITRWQILNLARVWLDPMIQRGGEHYIPNAATQVIAQALQCIPYDYLRARPPVFLDEPYEITECLSYCDTRIHRGTLYKAANFHLVRENSKGIQTYSRPLRRLTHAEKRDITRVAYQSPRYNAFQAKRRLDTWQEIGMIE
jgi:hypothetical protein